MIAKQVDSVVMKEQTADLEIALMEEYLGCSLASLRNLPEQEAARLRTAASSYASVKLEAVRARAHVVQELRGPPAPM